MRTPENCHYGSGEIAVSALHCIKNSRTDLQRCSACSATPDFADKLQTLTFSVNEVLKLEFKGKNA